MEYVDEKGIFILRKTVCIKGKKRYAKNKAFKIYIQKF